jgi:hypothetical protein
VAVPVAVPVAVVAVVAAGVGKAAIAGNQALLNTTTFGAFPREYSPLTLRVGINRIETSEMPTGIAG